MHAEGVACTLCGLNCLFSIDVLKRFDKTLVFLLLIIMSGAVLRLYAIESVPSFNQDEAEAGYDAYSILHTGRDQFGNFMPVMFREFGAGILPFTVYALVPFEAVFGLNEFAVRLPGVLLGVLLIFLSYLLFREFFENRVFALLAAAFVAFSPWAVHLSRFALPNYSIPFLTVLGLYFLIRGLKRSSGWLITTSAVPFGLCLYTYAVTKLFIPLLVLGVVLIYSENVMKNIKWCLYGALVLTVLCLPLALSTMNDPLSNNRFNMVSIFSSFPQEQWAVVFLKGYFSYYSSDYLFLQGDNSPTHSIYHTGVIPWFMLPLLVVGLLFCLFERSKPVLVLLVWLVIFPFASSLTTGSPNALRSFTMLPVFQLIAAFGAWKLSERVPFGKLVLGVVLILGVWNVGTVFHYYFSDYPTDSAEWYSYGYKEIVQYMRANDYRFEEFAFKSLNQPYIFVLMYLKYPPLQFQKDDVSRSPWRPGEYGVVYSFNKYRFIVDVNECFSTPKSVLYVAGFDQLVGVPAEKTILYPDRRVAFRLVSSEKCREVGLRG